MIELRLGVRARPGDPDPDAVRLVQESRTRAPLRLAGRPLDRPTLGGAFLLTALPFAR